MGFNAYSKIIELRNTNAKYKDISRYLNENGFTTRQGKKFTPLNIKTIYHRIKTGKAKEVIEDLPHIVQTMLTPNEAKTLLNYFGNDKKLRFCVKMIIKRAVDNIERLGDY